MNNEQLYKALYEASLQDNKELRKRNHITYLEKIKQDLGQDYWDFKDYIVVSELMEIIENLEDPEFDPFETPDNKAIDLSSAYRMLNYYLTIGDYKVYVKSRKLYRDVTND